MFRFLKNRLKGACFALLNLLVSYMFSLFWVVWQHAYEINHINLCLISITYIRLRQKLFVVVCSFLLRLILLGFRVIHVTEEVFGFLELLFCDQ